MIEVLLKLFKYCLPIVFILFISCVNEKDKEQFLDTISNNKETSLDSLIILAKIIDENYSSTCEMDNKVIVSPTTVCYLNNEIKKIIETRLLNFGSFDTTSKAKVVTHRIIYLINKEYTLVLHPNFDSPLAIKDKWNWSKVIIKNNGVIQYKAQDYKNHKGIFLSKKSSRFINAQNYYPIRIELLLNKYNKQSK